MKNNSKLKIIANFRAIFFVFVLGILCVFFASKCIFSLYYMFFFAIPFAFCLLCLFKKRFYLCAFSLVFFVVVSVGCYAKIANFEDKTLDGKSVTFSGKIVQIDQKREGSYYILFQGCQAVDENGNLFNIPGLVSAYVTPSNNQDFAWHNRVVFDATLVSNSSVNNKKELNEYYIKNNIKYSIAREYITFAISSNDESNLIDKIHTRNKTILTNSVGEEKAEIMFALLYGNKSNAPDNLLDLFKQNGVSHLFAVSGLHVAILIAAIYFLLSIFHIKEGAKFAIISMFLLCFCALCSFSSATVRASVMAEVLLFAKLVARRYDILNSVSFAGTILLAFNPLNLFDLGFQMTFGAVFGIVCVGGLLRKIKIKNTFLKVLFLSFATTLTAQIGILPILAKHFSISTWSVLANLLVVPIFEVLYPLLFVVNLLCFALPAASFLFVLPKALLDVIIYSNVLLAKLPFSSFNLADFGVVATLFYYLAIFVASNYFVVRAKTKLICLGILALCFAFFVVNNSIVASQNDVAAACQTYVQQQSQPSANLQISLNTSLKNHKVLC